MSRSYDPQRRGDRGGDEQQDDEDVLELGEKAAPRRHRLLGVQLVRPVAFELRPGVVVAQTVAHVGPERLGDILHGLSIRAHCKNVRSLHCSRVPATVEKSDHRLHDSRAHPFGGTHHDEPAGESGSPHSSSDHSAPAARDGQA